MLFNDTTITRFWAKVDKNGPLPRYFPLFGQCWLWIGAGLSSKGNGYGLFYWDGRLKSAHRFSYELHLGSIPDGLTIDHLCRVKACVKPAHLEPVTIRENILRGTSPAARNASQNRCHNGHPFSKENTASVSGRPHSRRCRACDRESARKRLGIHPSHYRK